MLLFFHMLPLHYSEVLSGGTAADLTAAAAAVRPTRSAAPALPGTPHMTAAAHHACG
jgi:hypothetical protein